MRTTVAIDDALYEITLEMADLFREAIKTFVRVQAAIRFAASGGSNPEMPAVPRRKGDFKK